MKITDLTEGSKVIVRLCLAEASIRKTKGTPPKDYLSVVLTDGQDNLGGNMWDYKEAAAPEIGKVYMINGNIGSFAGKKQITLNTLTLADDQSMTEFSCTYESDLGMLWDRLLRCINNIQDRYLRDVTEFLYIKYKDQILQASSAKAVHHVGIGGNAAHTLEVYDYANGIVDTMEAAGKLISRDLVSAGALLHDIGKIFTYSITGPVIEVTQNGQLFDHIVIGMQLMGEAAQMFDQSYNKHIAFLSHIIASHHGQLEYGSPVTPRFAEAYVVNLADTISAQLDTLYSANTKATKEGKTITDKIYVLGNREHILQRTVDETLSAESNTSFNI